MRTSHYVNTLPPVAEDKISVKLLNQAVQAREALESKIDQQQ